MSNNEGVVEIEIIRAFKTCWKVGQRREVAAHFAAVLIEGGYAKPVRKEQTDGISIH